MFGGKKTIRFCTAASEAAVRQAVRKALGGLGRVTIDRAGAIRIEPAARFRSPLAATTLAGTLRRELNEYDVSIRYACDPSPLCWAIIIVGTLPLLLGWAAALAPRSMAAQVRKAVGDTLDDIEDALGGAAAQRYGRKDARP
jgi:hypothetical protein